jgi:hypothetical protein
MPALGAVRLLPRLNVTCISLPPPINTVSGRSNDPRLQRGYSFEMTRPSLPVRTGPLGFKNLPRPSLVYSFELV